MNIEIKQTTLNNMEDCPACNDCNDCEQKTDFEHVMQFTTESGTVVPEKPEIMNKEEVSFITKMIIDELLELLATVFSADESKSLMVKLVQDAKSIDGPMLTDENDKHNAKVIAEQVDSFVDQYYYMLNAACKKNMNMSEVFKIVHEANMNKRDPVTGKFVKRSDGKIIKPQGWKEPNIVGYIEEKLKNM